MRQHRGALVLGHALADEAEDQPDLVAVEVGHAVSRQGPPLLHGEVRGRERQHLLLLLVEVLAQVAAQRVQPLLSRLLRGGVTAGPRRQRALGPLQQRQRLLVLPGHVVDQFVRAGTALTQEREDQLLLAVVVRFEKGQDVLVVVGDQRDPLGVARCDAPDQRGCGAEAVPEDAVHRKHVVGVGAWCSS